MCRIVTGSGGKSQDRIWSLASPCNFYDEKCSSRKGFTERSQAPICLNDVEIPPAATVKYLGLRLDTKLNWKVHIIKNREQIALRHKELYWLLGRTDISPLSRQ
jgi:hypothetical protein